MPGEFRRGVRLAVDWGTVRVGVAACDPDGLLAHPVTTLINDATIWARLAGLIGEFAPMEVLLGYPIDLRGRHGLAARRMSRIAGRLAEFPGVRIRLIDERLSSTAAHRKLADSGRTTRARRSIVDQVAAVEILEQALEFERFTGRPAGRVWQREDRGDGDESISDRGN